LNNILIKEVNQTFIIESLSQPDVLSCIQIQILIHGKWVYYNSCVDL